MTTLTVTATQGGSTSASLILRVFVLTGAKAVASQTGAATNNQFSGATTWTQSITTTAGSNVYGAAAHLNGSANTASNSTLIDSIDDGTNAWQYITFKALNVAAGALARGFTTVNPSTGPFAQQEILAATTLAEDGSAPALASGSGGATTSQTTASFTPPAGSLLVALVSSNGGGAQTTMTVTDNLGGHLNWTEMSKNNPAGGDYAGIWIADVPAAGGAAFVPLQPTRRIPYRVEGLRLPRPRLSFVVPAQLNPPYPFTVLVQRRQAWPRALRVKGRVVSVVPDQSFLFPVIAQRRQEWPRGLPRRGRITIVTPAQLNPPYPWAEIRQWRQPRGFWPVRGKRFEPPWGQAAAAPPPPFVWQQVRNVHNMFPSPRGRRFEPPWGQAVAPPPAVPAVSGDQVTNSGGERYAFVWDLGLIKERRPV